jgi:hypothetical protein
LDIGSDDGIIFPQSPGAAHPRAAIRIAIGICAAGIFIGELFRQFATSLVNNDLRTDTEELMTLIDVDSGGFPHLTRPLSDPHFGQDGFGFVWQVSRGAKA